MMDKWSNLGFSLGLQNNWMLYNLLKTTNLSDWVSESQSAQRKPFSYDKYMYVVFIQGYYANVLSRFIQKKKRE